MSRATAAPIGSFESESVYAKHLAVLTRLRERAKKDPTLDEFAHALAWAIDGCADDYERGYRKGAADAKKKAAERMRMALAGLG